MKTEASRRCRDEHHVKMEAEMGEMCPHAKEGQGLLAAHYQGLGNDTDPFLELSEAVWPDALLGFGLLGSRIV